MQICRACSLGIEAIPHRSFAPRSKAESPTPTGCWRKLHDGCFYNIKVGNAYDTVIIPHIEDYDLKALKPLLDRMGIQYKKQVIKEIDDSELLLLSKKLKNSSQATAKEQKEALDKIRGL